MVGALERWNNPNRREYFPAQPSLQFCQEEHDGRFPGQQLNPGEIMKTDSILSLLLAGTLLGATAGAVSPSPVVDSAIQAIQQAPEPSAAVAAYANAIALERTQPKIYEAYLARMVDFGMPELAYDQAQTLTGLNSSNGLAWGVIAHVDARRGDMPEALAAINLAGQSDPENTFIQRTAGEILAWYDLEADKSKLPDQTKAGLDQIRSLLAKRPDYIAAYDKAKEAYQTTSTLPAQSTTPTPYQPPTTAYQPQSSIAPGAYASPIPGDTSTPPQAVDYAAYASYSYPYDYAYGPGWVAPAPWWWWAPTGFFVGFNFFPFNSVSIFHDHDFFRHHHGFFHHQDGAVFHHDGRFFAHDRFFGTTVRPKATFARLNHARFVNGSGMSVNTPAVPRFQGSPGAIRPAPLFSARPPMMQGFNPAFRIGAGNLRSRAFAPAPRFAGPRFGGMGMQHFGMGSRTFAPAPRFAGPRFGGMGVQHFALRGGGGFRGGMGGFHGGGFPGGMGGFHGGGGHSGGGRR